VQKGRAIAALCCLRFRIFAYLYAMCFIVDGFSSGTVGGRVSSKRVAASEKGVKPWQEGVRPTRLHSAPFGLRLCISLLFTPIGTYSSRYPIYSYLCCGDKMHLEGDIGPSTFSCVGVFRLSLVSEFSALYLYFVPCYRRFPV